LNRIELNDKTLNLQSQQ